MFGVVMQGPERAGERTRQPFAELRTHADGAQGLGPESGKIEFNGLVQRNAEHVVEGLQMTLVVLKHERFFLRQTRSPIQLDAPAAGQGGAALVFQEGPPRAQGQEYSKRIPVTTTCL